MVSARAGSMPMGHRAHSGLSGHRDLDLTPADKQDPRLSGRCCAGEGRGLSMLCGFRKGCEEGEVLPRH